jgi:hypothetical protein
MAKPDDIHASWDTEFVVYPQVFDSAGDVQVEPTPPPEVRFTHRAEEREEEAADRRRFISRKLKRRREGSKLWKRIQAEFLRDGRTPARERALRAFLYVKIDKQGSAAQFAKSEACHEVAIREAVSAVEHVAYGVGYDLREDKLVVTGNGSEATKTLRDLVADDSGSADAWEEFQKLEAECADDPHYLLCGCHIHRARGDLLASVECGTNGLKVAVDSRVRSLLENALGQTLLEPDFPDPSRLDIAESRFRRSIAADPTQYFGYANLAMLAWKYRGDRRRAQYWLRELASARRRMSKVTQRNLAVYLDDAAWTGDLRDTEFWKKGPRRWISAIVKRSVLPLILLAAFLSMSTGPLQVSHPIPRPITQHDGAGGV